jgi:hypothetical protein
MTQEALRMVLDALENGDVPTSENAGKNLDAITAIKQALAQTQDTWVGLTRDEQSFVYSNLHNATSRKDSFWVDFANAIEAKLKEKNGA